MQNPPLIWVLADNAPGHRNQAIGVARALGGTIVNKSLEYTKLAALPNSIKGASLLGLASQPKAEISPPWPDIVVAAGRRTAPVARYIKKKSGGKSFTVQLMWPGKPIKGLDLLVIPEHDGIPASDNIILTRGAPHHLTREELAKEAATWEPKFAHLPGPRIALLVGGSVGKMEFTVTHGARLAYLASRMAGQAGGSLMVTSSRRTPEESRDRLKKSLAAPNYWYDVSRGIANPYLGILGAADAIVATGDSVSMCSEACFLGKPVFIYAPADLIPEKHQKFLDKLFADGYASPLLEAELPPEKWRAREGRVLDEASRIAEEILRRIT